MGSCLDKEYNTFSVSVTIKFWDTVCFFEVSTFLIIHCIVRMCVYWMDGLDFMSFSTVFQSYQDDERVILKNCVQWNTILCMKSFYFQRESDPGQLYLQANT